MNFQFDGFDILLIAGVSILVTIVAFIHSPRVKALVYSIPVPFTPANLSLGSAVGASRAAGLLNLLLFLNLARRLHKGFRINIVVKIAVATAVYIGIGMALIRMIPDTSVSFWICSILMFAVAASVTAAMPALDEPAHRSELPVHIKFAAVAGVVTLIVVLKNLLGGFMTTFPLAGVVTVYEARKSLWTLSRHATLLVFAVGSMIVTMRLVQQYAGLSVPLSLLPGWGAWLLVMVPATMVRWRREDRGGRSPK